MSDMKCGECLRSLNDGPFFCQKCHDTSRDTMTDQVRRKLTAGNARHAAHILVDVWQQMGSDYSDYDVVWQAKEYLHDCADKMPDGCDFDEESGRVRQ